jgi:hypothetical protein
MEWGYPPLRAQWLETTREVFFMTPRRVLALMLCCAGLYAQDFRATLSGTVTDPSGAAIPSQKYLKF